MFLPIRTDSPLRSTPWMNWAIILVNAGVFLAMYPGRETNPNYGWAWTLQPNNPSLATYLSYAFMHQDIWHLLSNMLFLYIFGNNVNDKMGNFGYLGFYLAGGVVAGIGHVLTSTSPVLGASGAVAAVTGAYLVLFPRSSITVIYFFIFIGSVEIPSMWFIGFFFIKDLILGFGGQATKVAHMTHVSGTVFGFGICFVLLLLALLPRNQFDVLALVQRWNKRRQYQEMVKEGYNPFGYTSAGREDSKRPAPKFDPAAEKIHDLRARITGSISSHNLPQAADLFLELQSLDPKQVLPRQAQLDIANQLASQGMYAQAADAYERFLYHYPKYEQIEQIELVLGLIYTRYLQKHDRAKQYLLQAMPRLHGVREADLAREELAKIESLLVPRGPATS